VVVPVRGDEGLAELAEGGEDGGEGFVFLLLGCFFCVLVVVVFCEGGWWWWWR
jgi:hypothetical protein